MRTCILANGPTPKKTHTKMDRNIGHHLKNKNKGTPKVFQRVYIFTYTLKEFTALGRSFLDHYTLKLSS